MTQPFILAADMLRVTVSSSMALTDGLTLNGRREAIRLRRLMWTLIADLESATRVMPDADQRRECLIQIGNLRAATALHHSSWPVTLVRLDDEDYKRSIRTMTDVHRDFHAWVGRSFGSLRPRTTAS